MTRPGMGAMLHALGGGSKESAEKYYGKKIKNAKFIGGEKDKDKFVISFTDGVTIEITDEGQSCCEHRYMVCDDKPSELKGQKLVSITVKPTEIPHEKFCKKEHCDAHDVAFLEVQGNKSSVSFATHNEHNGYYGGFGLNISEV